MRKGTRIGAVLFLLSHLKLARVVLPTLKDVDLLLAGEADSKERDPRRGASPCTALTIAGLDSSGGAGIQADLNTFQRFGVHGASALVSLQIL